MKGGGAKTNPMAATTSRWYPDSSATFVMLTPRTGASANVAGLSIGPGMTAKMMVLNKITQKAASFLHLGQNYCTRRSFQH